MFRYTKFAAISVALASAAAIGFAATNAMENDAVNTAATMTKTKFSLVQAITTAEQHVSGKASRAEYEQTKTGWAYDVEVVAGSKVFDVRVDADKGTVISSVEDQNDRDDEHDKKD